MATRLECAALSDAVYGGTVHENNIPEGWEQIDLDSNPETLHDYIETASGFAAAVYGKDANNDGIYEEIVVSFRGTEPTNLNDLITDLLLGADIVMQQIEDALDFYADVRDQFIGTNITITGHSLGGALAQLVGSTVQGVDNYYAETYAFNAPGVSQFLDDLGILTTQFSTIHNYINMSDIVGNLTNTLLIGDHVGDENYLSANVVATTPTFPFNPHMVYNTEPIGTSAINWTFQDAMSLWWYDKTNLLDDVAKLSILTGLVAPSRNNLEIAVSKLNQVEPPAEILQYTTSVGDIVIGTADSDTDLTGVNPSLYNQGNDIIYGNEGSDVLIGLSGNDSLYGDKDVLVTAQDGNDELYGGSGTDYIIGGGGDDLLVGGEDKDTLVGGFGSDRYVFDDNDAVVVGNEVSYFNDVIVETAGEANGLDDTLDFRNVTNPIHINLNNNDKFTSGGVLCRQF